MHKKIIYILFIISVIFLLSSCAESFDSIKRGLTGQKKNSADEFMVKKKDPLILPPDYENLPVPDEGDALLEESSIFENVLETDDETVQTNSKSVETSILKKIKSK